MRLPRAHYRMIGTWIQLRGMQPHPARILRSTCKLHVQSHGTRREYRETRMLSPPTTYRDQHLQINTLRIRSHFFRRERAAPFELTIPSSSSMANSSSSMTNYRPTFGSITEHAVVETLFGIQRPTHPLVIHHTGPGLGPPVLSPEKGENQHMSPILSGLLGPKPPGVAPGGGQAGEVHFGTLRPFPQAINTGGTLVLC